MPVSVFGGEILTKTALNCLPCSRSVPPAPDADAYSPGATVGVCPTRVMSSRSPLTFRRRTQNPLSALWNVTRSTSPARRSGSGLGAALGGLADMNEALLVVSLLKCWQDRHPTV
jgi:hypothetical protein